MRDLDDMPVPEDGDPWQQERQDAEFAAFLAGDPEPLPWPPVDDTSHWHPA